ncbi:MAG TPA: alkaline phosphatase family protein [Terriglobales bacterium]|nr:alkaline phosphatase family protein [Terriglobales bacterium]
MSVSRRDFLKIAGVSGAGVVSGCRGLGVDGDDSNPQTAPPQNPAGDLSSIQHVVFTMQENRSFDHYFGKLAEYRLSKGVAGEIDVTPPTASNPGWQGDPVEAAKLYTPYHLSTGCHENLSPSWNESHVQRNLKDPTSPIATLDGFVHTAATFARNRPDEGNVDIEGHRAMGFYDASDLPYYYELATQFATSDRMFASLLAATLPNRLYLLGGSSYGRVYPDIPTPQVIDADSIFDRCEAAGVTWKIYVNGGTTYYQWFRGYASHQNDGKIVDAEQFFVDAANGTLPNVAMVESGANTGLDEHPKNNIQEGSAYMARFFNALMASPLWKKSAMFLTYDEHGGFYDHVPPADAVAPDDIPPQTNPTDIAGDFTKLGFRVPFIAVSPWIRKNYVSHTVADHTSILKFIEKRFNLASLTRRDAAAHDLLDMFDFSQMSWPTPPPMPAQPVNGVCDWSRV